MGMGYTLGMMAQHSKANLQMVNLSAKAKSQNILMVEFTKAFFKTPISLSIAYTDLMNTSYQKEQQMPLSTCFKHVVMAEAIIEERCLRREEII